MKRIHMKRLVAANVLSLISGAAGLPVFADCHHSMQCHMHHSRTSFAQHHATTRSSVSNSVACISAAPLSELLIFVQSQITALDNSLTESLGKITEYQDLQFSDQANSKKYNKEIFGERQKVDSAETELSAALGLQEEIKARIGQSMGQHPIENASSNNPSQENLD